MPSSRRATSRSIKNVRRINATRITFPRKLKDLNLTGPCVYYRYICVLIVLTRTALTDEIAKLSGEVTEAVAARSWAEKQAVLVAEQHNERLQNSLVASAELQANVDSLVKVCCYFTLSCELIYLRKLLTVQHVELLHQQRTELTHEREALVAHLQTRQGQAVEEGDALRTQSAATEARALPRETKEHQQLLVDAYMDKVPLKCGRVVSATLTRFSQLSVIQNTVSELLAMYDKLADELKGVSRELALSEDANAALHRANLKLKQSGRLHDTFCVTA